MSSYPPSCLQKQRRSGERSSQASCFHEAWELLFFLFFANHREEARLCSSLFHAAEKLDRVPGRGIKPIKSMWPLQALEKLVLGSKPQRSLSVVHRRCRPTGNETVPHPSDVLVFCPMGGSPKNSMTALCFVELPFLFLCRPSSKIHPIRLSPRLRGRRARLALRNESAGYN